MKILTILLILCLLVNVSYATDLKEISDEAVKGYSTDEQKIHALREYVYNHMKPYGNGYKLEDTKGKTLKELWEMGVGWCNHQVDMFMLLAREQGYTTRSLYLLTEDMHSSPHTIAEIRLGIEPKFRWVVVDVGNNVDFVNSKGKMATRSDMATDFSILEKAFEGNDEYGGDEEKMRYFINPAYLVKVLEP